MRFRYRQTESGFGAPPRPIVSFVLQDSPALVDGLLDTGAIHTIIDVRLAAAAGITLTGQEDFLHFAGGLRVIRQPEVVIRLAGHQLRGEVCFAADWPNDFQLLGSATVLQHLRATFDGPREEVEL